MTATAGDDAHPTFTGECTVSDPSVLSINRGDVDAFERNEITYRIERFPLLHSEEPAGFINVDAQKIAAWLPATDEVIRDTDTLRVVPIDFGSRAATGMLIAFEPWRAPNRNPMPTVVPFPRLARAEHRARAALQRAREAFDVLRHGLPETDW